MQPKHFRSAITKANALIQTTCALLALIVLAGCSQARISAPVVPHSPSLDNSIALVYVHHLSGPTLEVGRPAHFLVGLEYTLNLYDSARLSLDLEQIADPNSCIATAEGSARKIPVQTPSGATIPIFKGTHLLEIPVTWDGNPGTGKDGRYIKTGTITFESSMVTADRSRYKFLTRSFGNEYCMRF